MSNGLGRGLSSLIPQKVKKVTTTASGEAAVDLTSQIEKDKILHLSPDKIEINPMQPRKKFGDFEMQELADSIKHYGIIQPLIVSKKGQGFELIVGERRLRAAKILNLDSVPVIVRQAVEQEKLELALIENLQRENLNPIEMALAYRKLIDEFNLTQEEVAERVGKARPTITNALRLLNLPDEIQQAIMAGKLTENHAKVIAGLDSQEKQIILFKKILEQRLSIEETFIESRRMGGTKRARIKINYADKDKELAFRQFFGSKVEIKRRGKGGRVIIDFYSDEELGEMTEKIKKQ